MAVASKIDLSQEPGPTFLVEHQPESQKYPIYPEGKYKGIKKIEWGAYSDVYFAYQVPENIEVALKVSKLFEDRTQTEEIFRIAKNEADLFNSHVLDGVSHVVLPKEIYQKGKRIVLVFDFLGKYNVLEEYMQSKENRMSFSDLEMFAIQIIEMFIGMNENNIVHADLNHRNLFYTNGILKVIDFGLSFIVGENVEEDLV